MNISRQSAGVKEVMSKTDQSKQNGLGNISNEEQWPGIDSRYRLIVVAALRSKQLVRGAHPRIDADPLKRRNTSIALEEVKRGLVAFTISNKDAKNNDSNLNPATGEGE
jgi:DNA-directed RNA polymerase omega subunit